MKRAGEKCPGLCSQRPRRSGRAGLAFRAGALLLGAAVTAVSVCPAGAQSPALPETTVARSVSGQFVVQGPPAGMVPWKLPQGGSNYVKLDPTLVSISCERVKQIVARELAVNTPWRGKVFVLIKSGLNPEDNVLLHAQRFRDNWDYQVQFPPVLERTRFVRAVVSVVMLEMANRSAGDHCAEVPAWLIEGVTAELIAASDNEIVLTPPEVGPRPVNAGPFTVNERRSNPLEPVRSLLAARGALSFDDLSWPTPGQRDGTDGGVYISSSHLFVRRLMLLPGGRECLGRMLLLLPESLNWQLAFLRAYQGIFPSLLDVEKWWTLQVINFTGRELSQAWSEDESRTRLTQALVCRVQIRSDTNDLPMVGELPLQTVIQEWAPAAQTSVLQGKLQELEMLRMRVAVPVLPLVDSYCKVLRTYLTARQSRGLVPFWRSTRERQLTVRTLRQLDDLDRQRRQTLEKTGTVPKQ